MSEDITDIKQITKLERYNYSGGTLEMVTYVKADGTEHTSMSLPITEYAIQKFKKMGDTPEYYDWLLPYLKKHLA